MTTPAFPTPDSFVASGYEDPSAFSSVEYQAQSSKQAVAKAPVHPIVEIKTPEVCQIPKQADTQNPVTGKPAEGNTPRTMAKGPGTPTAMGRPIAPIAKTSLPDPDAVRIIGDAGGEQTISLAMGVTSIGGGPRCAIRLESPCRPMHCVISRDADKVTVRRWAADTLLNGRSFTEAPLHIGDQLTIAGVELLLVTEQGSQSLTDLPAAVPKADPAPPVETKPESDQKLDFNAPEAKQENTPAASPTELETLEKEPATDQAKARGQAKATDRAKQEVASEPVHKAESTEASKPIEASAEGEAPQIGAACVLPSAVPSYLLKPWEDAQTDSPKSPTASDNKQAPPTQAKATPPAEEDIVEVEKVVAEVRKEQSLEATSATGVEIDSLAADAVAPHAESEALKAALAQTRRRARQVVQGFRTQRHENAVAQQHVQNHAAQLESTCEWLRGELDETLVKLDENKRLSDALQAELAEKKNELCTAEGRLQELQDQLAEETAARQSLEAQVDELLVQASELLEAQQASLAERENLQATVETLQSQFQELQSQVEQLQTEKAELADISAASLAAASAQEFVEPEAQSTTPEAVLPEQADSAPVAEAANPWAVEASEDPTDNSEVAGDLSSENVSPEEAAQPAASIAEEASEVVDVNPWLAMTDAASTLETEDSATNELAPEEPATEEPVVEATSESKDFVEPSSVADEPLASEVEASGTQDFETFENSWQSTPVSEDPTSEDTTPEAPISEAIQETETASTPDVADDEPTAPTEAGGAVWDIEKASGAFWSTNEEEAATGLTEPTETAATPEEKEAEVETREVELPETDQAPEMEPASLPASTPANDYSDLWATPKADSASETTAEPASLGTESPASVIKSIEADNAPSEAAAPSGEAASADAWLQSFSASLADTSTEETINESVSLDELSVPLVAEDGAPTSEGIAEPELADSAAEESEEAAVADFLQTAQTISPEEQAPPETAETLADPAVAPEPEMPQVPETSISVEATEPPAAESLASGPSAEEPTEEPTSFLERYAHLLPPDDEEPGSDLPAAAMPVSQPVSQPTTPAPAPIADESSSEDSIDDYMAKLMQRVRGEDTPDAVPAASQSVAKAQRPTHQTTPAQQLAPAPEPAPPVKPLESLEELRGGRAPEQARDMSALRDLANDTARNAIGVAAKKSGREKTYAHLAASGIMVAVGAYLAASSTGLLSKQLALGLAILLSSGYWLTRSLAYFRKEKPANSLRASVGMGLPIDRV